MDSEKYKTADMYTGSKKDLFENRHPVVRLLSEVDEILMPTEEKLLTEEYISLKKLFTREMMDEWHIDSRQLLMLAGKMLDVCEQLAERNITPGFYDLEDIFTNKEYLYIRYPERFQLLSYEQDYEWYPEEEKLFGEIELLEEPEQEIADCRIIYKILVASTRGNVKVPPKMSESDYSDIFYQKLSPELKQFFQNPADYKRELLKDLLERALRRTQESLSQERIPLPQEKTEESDSVEDEEKTPLSCLYLILRTNPNQSSKMGKLLYDFQDMLEIECKQAQYDLYQSFVYGDGNISLRKLKKDSAGFRIQMKNRMKSYSAGEAIVIAADYLNAIMKYWEQGQEAIQRCVILVDGELQNSPMFQYGIEQLTALKEKGVHFYLAFDKAYSGEACQKLERLLDNKEDCYVDQAFDGI